MSRTRTFPVHPFGNMDALGIADTVESDIKKMARQWRYAHRKSTRESRETAATETAALYLQANHALYFREEHKAMKDAHQQWMQLMQSWFLSIFEKQL